MDIVGTDVLFQATDRCIIALDLPLKIADRRFVLGNGGSIGSVRIKLEQGKFGLIRLKGRLELGDLGVSLLERGLISRNILTLAAKRCFFLGENLLVGSDIGRSRCGGTS